jgi:hypothetical protein
MLESVRVKGVAGLKRACAVQRMGRVAAHQEGKLEPKQPVQRRHPAVYAPLPFAECHPAKWKQRMAFHCARVPQ